MSAYYNENNPQVAAALRRLIQDGLITDGVVDERSIEDVQASDLRGFTRHHFFAGIAGWERALQIAEWPDDRPVCTGSPPCQDYSLAGCSWDVRSGIGGKRGSLAETWATLVGAFRPPVVFFENVPGISPWLAEIEGRLAAAGYGVARSKRATGDVGSPHLRRRVWLAADRDGEGLEIAWPERPFPSVGSPWRTTPRNAWRSDHAGTGVLDDGIQCRVALVRAAGNAIVPQVAAWFIRAYMEVRQTSHQWN